jgi:hypothetical protein
LRHSDEGGSASFARMCQILLLSSQIIFRMLKKANAFWMILKQ